MKTPVDVNNLSREELIDLICQQALQIKTLQEEIEELKRGGTRQSAPFSKEKKPETEHKKSGRKSGQGTFNHRPAPPEESYTEPPIDVKVNQTDCPDCGGRLQEERIDVATITDLPPEVHPQVKVFRVSVCRCEECGKQVRGKHPDLASDQQGATAHRLGPRIMAMAHTLHYEQGLPLRKVPEVLLRLTGISVTQGALTQNALRQAKGNVGLLYQSLRESVSLAPFVHTDDTGWRIGGETAFLMAFETDEAVVYQIRDRHRNEEVREIIPSDYPGTMICDRGPSYEAKEFSDVHQQKCISHVLDQLNGLQAQKEKELKAFEDQREKALKERKNQQASEPEGSETKRDEEKERQDKEKERQARQKEGQTKEALDWALEMKKLLQDDIELWKRFREGGIDPETFEKKKSFAKIDMAMALRKRDFEDPDQLRLMIGLDQWDARGDLLRFLDDPRIEPTNNRAERALRPAVIARKVSHCSKNEQGAEAYAAFKERDRDGG